jgi:hypothetical protein
MLPGASTIAGNQSVEDLRRELAEARQQQAATAGILAVISNSPTDASRVFAEIATSGAGLCDAHLHSSSVTACAFLLTTDHFLPVAPSEDGALCRARPAL